MWRVLSQLLGMADSRVIERRVPMAWLKWSEPAVECAAGVWRMWARALRVKVAIEALAASL